MTKEQALALCENDYQRKVVEATATATMRTKLTAFYAKAGVKKEDVKKILESKSRKYIVKAEEEELVKTFAMAKKQGFTAAQCIAAIRNLYKEKKKAELLAELAALEEE